jgi:hypothetical protein
MSHLATLASVRDRTIESDGTRATGVRQRAWAIRRSLYAGSILFPARVRSKAAQRSVAAEQLVQTETATKCFEGDVAVVW